MSMTLPSISSTAHPARTGVRADINSLEARIIRWIVGTTIAAASVAFTIARFVR